MYPGLYPVTPQQLFVHTIDDLEARLDLNRGEYDALMMAWLIRKLLHDGHRSLLAIVARERGIDDEDLPRFEIHDIVAPPQLIGPLPLAPIAGRPTRVLTGREFLRQDVLGVPDYAGGIEAGTEMATVSDLIFYLANVLGAVHVTERPEPLHRKMLDVTWTVNYTTPGGQFTGPVMALVDVARVVVAALGPLRDEIAGELWPAGVSDFARGVAQRPDAIRRRQSLE